MTPEAQLLQRLAVCEAVLVTVQSHRGSVPREAGAWMAVFADDVVGTIGGGHLEWQALAEARSRLAGEPGPASLRYALGASLGQCCGGEVWLQFERLRPADLATVRERFEQQRRAWARVALFGAGHVGRALVQVLAPLPVLVHWIDSREAIFPERVSEQVACETSDPVQAAVASLAAGSLVLVMNHSHVEDLDVIAACLQRQRAQADLGWIGLLGSKTKWATFGHRLAARGFSEQELQQVHCPIGVPGIGGKAPEVIALAVAAQVLQVKEAAAVNRQSNNQNT